jgi:hypothetical protein
MEITIGFEGQKRDLNDLVFDLFERHMLREGLEKETPGDVKIVMKPMELRKGYALALLEVAAQFGSNVVASLFAGWLVEKWKKNGAKRINIKIENRIYQMDPDIIAKAVEDALAKLQQKKAPTKALGAVASGTRQSSGGPKGRTKAQS